MIPGCFSILLFICALYLGAIVFALMLTLTGTLALTGRDPRSRLLAAGLWLLVLLAQSGSFSWNLEETVRTGFLLLTLPALLGRLGGRMLA